MKKLLFILLSVPMVGFGQIVTPVQQTNSSNLLDIIIITSLFVGHLLFAILIIRAGKKLNSGSLSAAGFLFMILWCFIIVFYLEMINLL